MSVQKKPVSRRDFLRVGSMVVGAAALAACTPAAPPAPAPTQAPQAPAAAPTATTAPAAPAPTATPAAAAPTAEPTPVVNVFGKCYTPFRLWSGLTGSDGAVFAEMCKMYSDADSTVCLESQGIPWDLFFQKYPTAVAAGTPPDMVIFH